MTPLTISELWKEEEEKTKDLFKKFKDIAESKGVNKLLLLINHKYFTITLKRYLKPCSNLIFQFVKGNEH